MAQGSGRETGKKRVLSLIDLTQASLHRTDTATAIMAAGIAGKTAQLAKRKTATIGITYESDGPVVAKY
jgi:hypothetical protein